MISRIGFAPALPSLTLQQAQGHWAGPHASVSTELPGVLRYWQNHVVLKNGQPLLPWAGFDCCSEFDFRSTFEMDRAFTSDKHVALVKPDEEVLLDKSKGGMLIADRHLIDGVAGDAAFRLMRFHRVAPLRSTAALADRLRVLPRPEGAAARELYIAVDGAAAGQRVACYDAVEIDWFDAAEAALAFALSADQRDRRRSYAELVRGTDFLIARVNRVL